MKVSTDSVLLGASVPIVDCSKVLDIGAGTGILSLMIAQRMSTPEIDAVEIDQDTYQECLYNIQKSIWANRINCYHTDIENFTENCFSKYDIIISNPPFYTEDYISTNQKRKIARSTQSLSFEKLLDSVAKLIASDGYFAVIIPYKEEKSFVELASKNTLYPKQITHIKGHAEIDFKRSLLIFSTEKKKIQYKELCIEISRHKYTPEYINLTKDFYLNIEKNS